MIKDLSEQFKIILKKKYISHIHTTYTDGLNSVEDYCSWAAGHSYEAVIFSEHVREKMSYNFDNYIQDIENARLFFPSLKILIGAESRVLPNGKLDISVQVLSHIQVLFFACHEFPNNVELYKTALTIIFKDKKLKKYPRVWAHPGSFFKRRKYSDESFAVLNKLIEIACNEDILIEKNLRDKLPPQKTLEKISPSNIIIGHDAHSIESIRDIEDNLESDWK